MNDFSKRRCVDEMPLAGRLVHVQIHLEDEHLTHVHAILGQGQEDNFDLARRITNHHAVAFGDVLLCLGHGLVGGSPRSEAVTVRGERRVAPLLENQQQGLLDQSVDPNSI